MDHLDELSVEELQPTLDEIEGKKSTSRLLAATAYKNGVTQTELAEWYGVERAVQDDHRLDRPRKFAVDQQK